MLQSALEPPSAGLPGVAGAVILMRLGCEFDRAAMAQWGARQTEDLKAPGSIPGLRGVFFCLPHYVLGREAQ